MKLSVFCGASVDGFIARPNDELDFLSAAGGEEPHGFEEFMATIDVMVMGRRTFEVVLGFGGEWPFAAKRVVVLSTRPLPDLLPTGSNIEHLSGTPREIADQLAASGAEHLYIDGGVTIQRFLSAGLIDRMIVTRVPILIGEGIPLFGSLPHDVRLRHVATRTYSTGLVQSEYLIENSER